MLYPVLPVFLTQTLHASGSVVGLIDGFAQAMQNIVQGFSGTLSDKLQRRKPIALAGLFAVGSQQAADGTCAGVADAVWRAHAGPAGCGFAFGAARRLDCVVRGRAKPGPRFRSGGHWATMPAPFSGRWSPCFCSTRFMSIIRSVFYLAIIPGLLAFCMALLVKEQHAAAANAKVDIRLHHFPNAYWKYLLVTALFGLGNSSNAFLILRTQDIEGSLPTTILIYAGFNLVAALISYPAGRLFDKWGGEISPARRLHHFPDRLSRLRPDAECRSARRPFYFLWIVSGNISHRGQVGRIGAWFRIGCAPAVSAGTIPPLGSCNSSPASSRD